MAFRKFLIFSMLSVIFCQSDGYIKNTEQVSLERRGVEAVGTILGNKAFVLEAVGKRKREVGHVEKEKDEEKLENGQKKKKYRRLAHDVRIQGEIRSRLGHFTFNFHKRHKIDSI